MDYLLKNKKFYLLDISRAIAAFCVVLQHYQHFYFLPDGSLPVGFTRNQQPFYDYLLPFYSFGTVAVQFFFTLSGFIFFLVYSHSIYKRKINFYNFTILRLSRLYPLHLLTLFIVIILQSFYFKNSGHYFIHDANDLKNLFLHIFLIQEWGFSNSWSYNAPSWSISVELILYVSFFFFSLKNTRTFLKSFLIFIILFIIFIFFRKFINQNILIGFLCFYIGAMTYFIFVNIIKNLSVKNNNKKYTILILLAVLNIIVFSKMLNNYFLLLQNQLEFLIGERFFILLFLIKFPLIILNLSLIQKFFPYLGKSFSHFGDISYTIYLIHFPIEIFFAFINIYFKIDYNNNFFFLLYLSVLIIISYLIFFKFENKIKVWARNRFINKN